MSRTFISDWLHESPEHEREYRREDLIGSVADEIDRVLRAKKWRQHDLAAALGCSKGHVSQLLNGSRNMTLRTLADIGFALDAEIDVSMSLSALATTDATVVDETVVTGYETPYAWRSRGVEATSTGTALDTPSDGNG